METRQRCSLSPGRNSTEQLNAIFANPNANRGQRIAQALGAGGCKLVQDYGRITNGPGALVIFEAPDEVTAGAICTMVVSHGLFSQRIERSSGYSPSKTLENCGPPPHA